MVEPILYLKDGGVMQITQFQMNRLRVIAVFCKDVTKQKVKINGRVITLDQIETDPKRIAMIKQRTLNL